MSSDNNEGSTNTGIRSHSENYIANEDKIKLEISKESIPFPHNMFRKI